MSYPGGWTEAQCWSNLSSLYSILRGRIRYICFGFTMCQTVQELQQHTRVKQGNLEQETKFEEQCQQQVTGFSLH